MDKIMNQAMQALVLQDEEDDPIIIPDAPEFSSIQENRNSLIVRLLNPDFQKASSVVFDMPGKWQLYNRVRGISLSNDRCQFFFTYEHDLEMVLAKGVEMYNDWPLVVARWVEHPPNNFLSVLSLWIRVRNIPMNHYTPAVFSAIGDRIGLVEEIAYDPTRSQENDSCQDKCPLLVSLSQNESSHPKASSTQNTTCVRIQQDDPLYGVLEDHQVGLNPSTGRPKIADEVLEELRRYILSAKDDEVQLRIARIRSTVAEVKKDPFTSKLALSLEPLPIISHNLDKGKGVVFEYGNKEDQHLSGKSTSEKLMSAAFLSNPTHHKLYWNLFKDNLFKEASIQEHKESSSSTEKPQISAYGRYPHLSCFWSSQKER